MAQRCTICTHPDLTAINHALDQGIPMAQIAAAKGVAESSLGRHRVRHTGRQEPTHIDPSDLLADLMAAKDRAEQIAYDPRLDPSDQLMALREVRQASETIAKLTGAYTQADPKAMLPMWARIRTALLSALERYPEAREAVIIALEKAMASD